jgi:hypothetical protein
VPDPLSPEQIAEIRARALRQAQLAEEETRLFDDGALIVGLCDTVEAQAAVIARVKDGWRLSHGAPLSGVPPFWYREDCDDHWSDHALPGEQQLVVYSSVVAPASEEDS